MPGCGEEFLDVNVLETIPEAPLVDQRDVCQLRYSGVVEDCEQSEQLVVRQHR